MPELRSIWRNLVLANDGISEQSLITPPVDFIDVYAQSRPATTAVGVNARRFAHDCAPADWMLQSRSL
jgi:hypothetical protein